MKKLLTTHTVRLLLAFLCLVGSFTLAKAWTVAGSSSVFGTNWDPSNTANDMTQISGTSYYIWQKNVTSTGSISFKICQDHNWNVSYPSSDYNYTIQNTGLLTITFKEDDHAITVFEGSNVWRVAGEPESVFGAPAWNTDNNIMTLSNGVYTWTSGEFTYPSSGDFAFKISTANWGASFPNDNISVTGGTAGQQYTLTVTFNPSTFAVNYVLNEVQTTPDWYLLSWTTSNFDANRTATQMTTSDNGATYTTSIHLDANTNFVFCGSTPTAWDASIFYGPASYEEITGSQTGKVANTGGSCYYTSAAGTWDFTYTKASNTWSATFTADVTPAAYTVAVIGNGVGTGGTFPTDVIYLTYDSNTDSYSTTINNAALNWFKLSIVSPAGQTYTGWGDDNSGFNSGLYGSTSSLSSGANTLDKKGNNGYNGGDLQMPVTGTVTLTVSNISSTGCTLTITGGTPVTHTYTVAGTSSAFGTNWDYTDTDNDMTLDSNTGKYTWTNNSFTATGNSIEFKVFVDHNNATAYPASNYQLTTVAGYTYSLTITYDPSNNDVSHELELVSATNKTWYLTNDFGGSWDTNNSGALMTANSTNTVYTWTYNFTSLTNDVKYFVLADALSSNGWSDDNWKNNNVYAGSTSDDTEIIPVPAGASAQLVKCAKSFKLPKGLKGTYTFTYDVANKTMTVAGAAPFEVKDWYLLSQFDTGSWQLNNSSDKFTYDEETGNYVLRKTISTNKETYFILSQKVASGAEKWSDINGSRYNPASNTEASLSTELDFGQNNDGAWTLPWGYIGTYTFTINAAGNKLTITGPARASRNTGKMYIIGNANAGVWQANHGVEMTETSTGSGIFVADNVQLMSGSDFSFTSKLGIKDDDWKTVNLYRWYAVSDNTFEVTDNMVGNYAATPQTNGDELSLKDTGDGTDNGTGNKNNFKMKTSGSYRITVNTNNKTVMFQQMYLDLYMFGKGFHWGNQTPNAWDPTSAIQMTTTDGKIYHLDAVTFDEGDAVGFIFSTVRANDNNESGKKYVAKNGFFPSNSDNYAIRYDETQNDINEQLTMVAGSTNDGEALTNFNEHRWFVWGETARSGKYNVVVDLENMTVMLKENININEEIVIRLEQTDNVTDPGIRVWINDGALTKFEGDWANGAEGTHMNEGNTNAGNVESQGKTYYLDGKTWFKCREYTSYDNRKWWEWEVGGDAFRIASITFYRKGNKNDNPADPNGDLNRRAGVLYYTWPPENDIEDHTSEYYIDHVKEAPECATMIDDHYYVYFVNTPGWSTVYCYAWDSNKNPLISNFPGSQCMVVGYTDDGFAVYRYDFGLKSYWQNMDVAGIVFNSGPKEGQPNEADQQTGDFPFKNGGVFDYVGRVSLGRSLGTIIAKGVVNGPLYEVEDELTIVYYDPYESGSYTVPIYEDGEQVGTTTTNYTGAFYAKDNNTANRKSLNTSGKRDYVFMTHFKGEKDGVNYELLMPGRTRYDQSNWVKLVCANDYASNSTNANWNAATLVGKKIAGDNLGGQLVDNLNPTMIVETLPANALSAASYTKNDYIMPHFNDNYTVNGEGDFFFVQPKPQEVATITWAVYTGKDGDNYQFYVPITGVPLDNSQYQGDLYGMFVHGNNFGLEGAINVKGWNLATVKNDGTVVSDPDMETLLNEGDAYTFDAIIRYKETPTGGSSGAPAVNRLKEVQVNAGFDPDDSQFEIYPIAIDVKSGIVTAIKDVKNDAAKTIQSVKVYDTMGVERREMQGGVNIVVTTYSDGTRSVQKILK